MTSQDYSNAEIVALNYPDLIQISEYEFKKIWQIKLKNEIPANLNLVSVSEELSFYGHDVNVEQSTDRQMLKVIVLTKFAITDCLFLNDYNLLAEIDYVIGEIEEIQGQVRELWYPWFSLKSGKKPKLKRYEIHEIQTGLRYSNQNEFESFGHIEVNSFIESGYKVISTHPGGAITRQLDVDNNDPTLKVIGFYDLVRLVKSKPSLAQNWL